MQPLRSLAVLLAFSGVTFYPPLAFGATGASTPFTTYEAEAGSLGGSASVVSLTAPPATEFSSPQLEASGHAYVSLVQTGDSVSWTNNTGQSITAINFRYSIPDAPNGGGISSTIDLYVNGSFRQAINVDSLQTWEYENSNSYNGMSKSPSTGTPHVFWDEARTFITGTPLAPGQSITLKKDSTNNAQFYWIDCIDLEAPSPLTQPANTLSITSYGAVPNNTSVDSTSAIQNCCNAAVSQGMGVWIPQGTFYLTSGQVISPGAVTIYGAGPWYSTICDIAPPSTWQNTLIFQSTSGTSYQNFCIDSTTSGTDTTGARMGRDAFFNCGNNWTINNVWARHLMLTWADGSNVSIQNCRVNNSYGDGMNLNNTAGFTCSNVTIQNNFARGNGDDGIAVNATNVNAPNIQNVTLSNNTSVASWWGNELAVYGGINITAQNNLVQDAVKEYGLYVGLFDTTGVLQGATITNNTVLRGGSHGYGIQFPGLGLGVGSGTVTSVYLGGNIVDHAMYDGIDIMNCNNSAVQNNLISFPGLNGMSLDNGSTGSAIFDTNLVSGLNASQWISFNNATGFSASTPTEVGDVPYEASNYNSGSAIQTESSSEGGLDVGYIGNGSYTVYNNINLDGVTSFAARLASPYAGETVTVHLDSVNGTVIGTVTVPNTGAWQTFNTVTTALSGASGIHNVYLVYTGGFNIKSFAFQRPNPSILAASYTSSASAQTETSAEGSLDVAYLTNGSYTEYNNVNLNGAGVFQARVASPYGGETINVCLDSPSGSVIGTCTVPNTGGWQTWANVECPLSGASGYHNLYLVYSGGFNIRTFSLLGSPLATEAASYNSATPGTILENCAEGGLDLANIYNGYNASFTSVDLSGATSFTARVASAGAGGSIQVHLDSTSGTPIGTCTVPVTGGWQTWTTVSCPISGATGYHTLYLVFTGGGGPLFNLENFSLNATRQSGVSAIPAVNYGSQSSGGIVENCSEGGQDVGTIYNGASFVYNNVNLNGVASFTVRTASAGAGGTINLRLDSPTGTVIGTCSVPVSGGWQSWTNEICPVAATSGYHNVYLVCNGSGGTLFNMQWLAFGGDITALPASSYSSKSSGAFLEGCSEGGVDMGGLNNGEYVAFSNVNLNGVNTFYMREASASYSGTVSIYLDNPTTGTLVGTCQAPNTGGWETWTTQSCSLSGVSGVHTVYLVYNTQGANLEWCMFPQ